MTHEQQVAYWKQNLIYIIVHPRIWFGVSFFAGIMIADQLDAVKDRRLPARLLVRQPGLRDRLRRSSSFVYVALMNNLDKKFGVYED